MRTLPLTGAVLLLIAVLAGSGSLLAPAPVKAATFPYEVSFAAAFLAGLLAILSPCSGAILPAFFGFAFDAGRGERLRLAYVFWLGLATVFVPIGFATSLLSGLFTEHRDAFFLAGGLVLIALGGASLLDVSARLSRAAGRVAGPVGAWLAQERAPTTKAYALGLVFGFATSSCTAPILGALQTLALGSAVDSVHAMALFLVFALGIATPVFALAWAADHAAFRAPRRTRSVFGRELPWTRVVTAAVLVALGVAFIAFRGTLDLTERYDAWGATKLYGDLNDLLVRWTGGLVGWALLLAGVGLLVWFLLRPRRRRRPGA